MRGQWGLIIGIIVALVIAIFSVINVEPVEVNYLFGQTEWPLVLIIIGSVLMGGIIVGGVGIYKIYHLQQEIKQLKAKQNKTPPPSGKKQPEKPAVKEETKETDTSKKK
ncbi:lipopolysaccharide assembly protein LapA domain-containing protein [Bacillus shivajii]|uniref:LapA family protein n=1 Tax=Bacillus shivajii TaxID=1983719 RepID=UPI001CF96848|nr:lipopolysaccharide assembly protein LapA domain-containing protein [Bacillus shivajii]UCZ54362.1 lipopolysaccharide assembly protein LapA domain-containing protein [Bacillus shivajii]